MNDTISPEQAYIPFVPPVTIELTSRCNFKCPYCANPTLKRDKDEMPAELVLRLADECMQNGYKVMAVHGVGEPLLRRDLEVILARFASLGIWTGWISSNGSLLTPQRMDSLVAAGLQGLYISVDTLDADLYAQTRGGKLSKTIENVSLAATAHPKIPFVIGLMNHKKQSIKSNDLDLFYSIFASLKNVHHHEYENIRFPQAREDWRRIDDKTGLGITFDTCGVWAKHFTIAVDGRVSLCCVDQEVDHPIGDVTKKSISDIWFNRRNQETFRSILLGLSESPKVCFKCILSPSKRCIDDVDPIFAEPYHLLLEAARKAEESGSHSRALVLFKNLLRRTPWDLKLKEKARILSEKESPGIFEISSQERSSRISSPTNFARG